jgi:flagellar protein FliT
MQDIIADYESVARASAGMRAAARRGDWDTLLEFEDDCRVIIEKIKVRAARLVLDDETRKRKMEIIHQILDDDAEIRNLMNPWLQQLQTLLGGCANRKKASRAYGNDL